MWAPEWNTSSKVQNQTHSQISSIAFYESESEEKILDVFRKKAQSDAAHNEAGGLVALNNWTGYYKQ